MNLPRLSYEEWDLLLGFLQHWDQLEAIAKSAFVEQDNRALLKIACKSPTGILLVEHQLAFEPPKSGRLLFTPLAQKAVKVLQELELARTGNLQDGERVFQFIQEKALYPSLLQRIAKQKNVFAGRLWLSRLLELDVVPWLEFVHLQHYFSTSESQVSIGEIRQLALREKEPFSTVTWSDLSDNLDAAKLMAICATDLGFWVPEWSFRDGLRFHWSERVDIPQMSGSGPLLFDHYFEDGMLLEDMRLILSMASHQKLRIVESEFRLYKKHEKEIQGKFQSLPEWYSLFDPSVVEDGKRLGVAMETLLEAGLADIAMVRDESRLLSVLEPTSLGMAFLHEDPDALQTLLKGLVVPGVPVVDIAGFEPYYTVTLGYLPTRTMASILQEVARGLTTISLQGVVPYRDLYNKMVPSPNVLKPFANYLRLVSNGKNNFLETLMGELLLRMVLRLSACGGAHLHFDSQQRQLGVELTPMGRYLLTRKGTMPLETKHVPNSLVVKPDYEIVFLQKDLRAEARIAPFCERIHNGHVGALFRISRKALHAAVENGFAGEDLLRILQDHSEKIPQNVAQEVKGWSEEIRTVVYRKLHALVFQSEEDARMAVSICPAQLRYLGGQIVEITQVKELKKIMARLAKAQLLVRVDS